MSAFVAAGALVLLAWVVAFVGYPLLEARAGQATTESEAERRRKELRFQRDTAYAAIRELETDHELGTLSSNDMTTLREQYTLRAAMVLKELDDLEAGMTRQADADIEEGVARYRRSRPSAD
ncbi:MAG: hypothetical protein Q7T26_12190 [Dehalococcoidia bacterium]|nr:hypothetical protein [Dehalococcoidia bacterium]